MPITDSGECCICDYKAEVYCENCNDGYCESCGDENMNPIILDGHDKSRLCIACYDKEFTGGDATLEGSGFCTK